jgi:hypothetical protein
MQNVTKPRRAWPVPTLVTIRCSPEFRNNFDEWDRLLCSVLDTSGAPAHVLGKPQGELRILELPVCWLQVGVHLEVSATGHLGFPVFF